MVAVLMSTALSAPRPFHSCPSLARLSQDTRGWMQQHEYMVVFGITSIVTITASAIIITTPPLL